MRGGYVYILASRKNGTLYVGVTNDLARRLQEHQLEIHQSFTSRYGVKTLVWFEQFEEISRAIVREKTIKKWRRAWKINLIEGTNPEWADISHWLL
ncbi:GIY-YIG nuclease family protein [Martelella alba]|uniref:GIY-YIG nuclease family protein n=1 Tax=Martelella alba TaxID=2590451 RepID=A0A506U819_9HYPH|nr:GIY-YIG nuclease family protein [Martelella alba]TPW29486.1 GIY-YIG nuclease family protein [Martelella alba]